MASAFSRLKTCLPSQVTAARHAVVARRPPSPAVPRRRLCSALYPSSQFFKWLLAVYTNDKRNDFSRDYMSFGKRDDFSRDFMSFGKRSGAVRGIPFLFFPGDNLILSKLFCRGGKGREGPRGERLLLQGTAWSLLRRLSLCTSRKQHIQGAFSRSLMSRSNSESFRRRKWAMRALEKDVIL